MKKPTAYFDTSIISAYWSEGRDVTLLSRRSLTREWWDLEREHYELWASLFTESELKAGKYARQHECVRMVRRLKWLPVTGAVWELAEEIVRLGIVPANKFADAGHLAISAMHEIDYLVTWNYAHMANPAVQKRFDDFCRSARLLAPLMVSPESIPQVRFGQPIRRSH